MSDDEMDREWKSNGRPQSYVPSPGAPILRTNSSQNNGTLILPRPERPLQNRQQHRRFRRCCLGKVPFSPFHPRPLLSPAQLTPSRPAGKKLYRRKPPNSKPSKPVSVQQKNASRPPHPPNPPRPDAQVRNLEHRSVIPLLSRPQKPPVRQVLYQRSLGNQVLDQ